MAAVFAKHDVGAVIHFAGLKAVGESVAKPQLYYEVNVQGTLVLLEVMPEAGWLGLRLTQTQTQTLTNPNLNPNQVMSEAGCGDM